MAYTVPAAAQIGQQNYTVTGVIQLMASTNPPANIAFPNLGNPAGHTTNLWVGQGAAINLNQNAQVTRAIGLISCASFCFVDSQTGVGYVYHANVGSIDQAAFATAIHAMGSAGPPYNSVYIAMAHPNATDPGYQGSIQSLIGWGVPTNNIVEITHLFMGQFGLNNLLQIGY
jgi:hypothetical protein